MQLEVLVPFYSSFTAIQNQEHQEPLLLPSELYFDIVKIKVFLVDSKGKSHKHNEVLNSYTQVAEHRNSENVK